MMLAPPGVRRDPCTKQTNQSLQLAFHDGHRECFRRLGNITLEGVKNSSKGSGATPAGSLAHSHGNSTTKKSLHLSASARIETRGLFSRISVRGNLTDEHSESIRMKVEASDSTLPPVVRTVLDDRSHEHGKSILRID